MTTIKRLVLIIATLVAIALATLALFNSWQEPQIQSRLELYQTNISLQAAELADQKDSSSLRSTIVGEKPLDAGLAQYQELRDSAQSNLAKVQKQLRSLPVVTPASRSVPVTTANPQQQLQNSIEQLQKLSAELDLRLGILQAKLGKTDRAIQTWTQQKDTGGETATVLTGLWSKPPRLLPNAQETISQNLDGWFRYQALSQLYQLEQRPDALTALKATEKVAAEQALQKLTIIGTIPTVTGLIGMVLLIFIFGQRLIKGKESLLAQNEDLVWNTPWDGETILQVFIFGFFFMGQLFIPLLLSVLPLDRSQTDVRVQAFNVLISYTLVAFGATGVLYLSIKRFLPLESDWFNFRGGKWFFWGFGGYCTALPLVIIVSLINQQLWQGQGGSNPLLQLALEAQDSVALGIFFFTAAIAAPLFEELLFRGFLLPSLTRYLPAWGAILVSSLLFAVAHLSLSEILPLTTLGIVLGVVYTRSRNLLASMLIHSLWNGGTLLSLFLLGSRSM